MKTFTIPSISKDETTQLKAYGILIIMLHNLFRWIKPQPWENEFSFSSDKIFSVFNQISEQPLETGNVIFSFFGHYGVQLFIILSAYGLMKAYMNKGFSWAQFMKNRYIKLWPSLFIAVFAYIYFQIYVEGVFINGAKEGKCFWHISTLAGFIPGTAESVNGPWWFYSLIFQVYAVIPFIIRWFKKYGNKVFIAIAGVGYLITILGNPFVTSHELNILHTVFGHLPEVVLGLWLASKPKINFSSTYIIAALILFAFGNFYKAAWHFSHVTAGILLVFGLLWFIRKTNRFALLQSASLFIGEISLYIFAIHGFLRWKFVGKVGYRENTLANILYALFFILLVIAVAYVLQKLENKLRAYVIQGTSFKQKLMRFLIPIALCIGFYVVLRYENKNYGKWMHERETEHVKKA